MADSHNDLIREVAEVAEAMQLVAQRKVPAGKTIWGSDRTIDVVASDLESGERIGILCRYQGTSGTTYEKIPARIEDIRAWPIRGIVVIAGDQFPPDFRAFLRGTGFAIELDELEVWLRMFFGRELA